MSTELQESIAGTESSATDSADASTAVADNTNSKKDKKKEKNTNGKRKRRWGDRKDGWRLRTINPMNKVMPFIMPMRCDACNTFAESINITESEKFVSEQIIAGNEGFSMLHVIVAAYIRTVSQHPALNRFISGQRVYARNDIQVVMTIKKKMTVDSPDTCIKIHFEPTDTIFDVYEKFNQAIVENKSEDSDGGSAFDSVMGTLSAFPRSFLRFAVWFLNKLDYHGMLPKFLLEVSPFHGSMIITSMGSLGIPAIYHHLYDFGNLPIFISYGSIFSADAIKRDGSRERHHFVTLKVVTDERICDGYYYASSFKRLKRYLLHPEVLDKTLESVAEDID